MSFSTTATEITYTGNGTDTTFAIPFYFTDSVAIKIAKYEYTDPLVPVEMATPVLNVDYQISGTNVILIVITTDPVTGDPVITPTALPTTQKLRIYRENISYHQVSYNTYQFPYPTANIDFDRAYQLIQELKTELSRAVKLKHITTLDGTTLTGEEILELIEQFDTFVQAGGALPPGGLEGDFIQKTDGTTGEWISGSYSGYSARFGENFSSTSLDDTIKKILDFSYLGPQISLSASPAQSVREKGDTVASVNLTADTTKRSNDILEVRFYRAGVLISTDAAPSADGSANSTYTDSTPFSDTLSFTAQVDDDTSTVGSNTVTYTFVYPYYSGAGAPGLSAAAVGGLTKDIRTSTASLNKVFTASGGDVFYFAYPASYGALTSILDENGFETFGDWTLRTENITGLDASAVSYRIYEFNNPVIASTTNYTFIR